MSWTGYVDNLLASSPAITRAAIVGVPDGALWARSEGDRAFQATADELKTFATLFDDPMKAPLHGAFLEKVRYVVPRADENIIFGKKEKQGFVAARTKSAALIAMFEGEAAAGSEVRGAVEKLAKFLSDSGY